MSGFFNILKQGAKTKTGKKIISKVVDYAVKKVPRKFKVAKTIKGKPPHTGTLKQTRAKFDEIAESASKGRSLHGKEWTTKTLMKGTPGKGSSAGRDVKLHDIVSTTGKLAQEIKKAK